MSQAAEDGGTPIPTTEQETAPAPALDSTVKPEEWMTMLGILNIVYNYRKDDDHDPSKVFHRKVNKRVLPSYYEVIKEPIALSTIKAKINTKAYRDFSEYVKDFALIFHNAQVYNRPEAPAYQDALDIKALFEQELAKLVKTSKISADIAKLPYMGEIPPPDELTLPAREDHGEEEDDDDDDDDDEDGEESDDSRGKKRGRGRPRKGSSTGNKRLDMSNNKEEAQHNADVEARRKRGRPPKLDTPIEARMKNIVRSMRRVKAEDGTAKIMQFERLPDKSAMPEYFTEIKNPMAVDLLKKKLRRKNYQTVEQFMTDVDLMFENAKLYNEDESQIYKDAVELQLETRKVAEQELKRPDTDFVDGDGRLPLPNGILQNGNLYKVGDWVHIQNPNDVTKTIILQIYRTWQDATGQKWINGCWYYRPEQTVHRFDKRFCEHEVLKTGQYRDHRAEELVDKCFVMFHTRYGKGKPRNFPADRQIYVCFGRYNEEKHSISMIKTWANCQPDDIRDYDYEMDLDQDVRKMKKLPTPIAYLLKEDAKETDDMPKPEWGADNAPPKIGAVHRRPRDPNKDSPPPRRTPTPPPRAPTPPPPSTMRPTIVHPPAMPARTPSLSNMNNTPQHSSAMQPPAQSLPSNYSNMPPHRPSIVSTTPGPLSRQISDPRLNAVAANTPQTMPHSRQHMSSYSTHATTSRYPPAAPQYSTNYKAPQPVEVWHLSDAANATIPPDLREQFERDEYGRVLFFTVPPVDTSRDWGAPQIAHSARYLAAKLKREETTAGKRKADEQPHAQKTGSEKRGKSQDEQRLSRAVVLDHARQSLGDWQTRMAASTKADFQALYGEEWQRCMQSELDRLAVAQRENVRRAEIVAAQELHRSQTCQSTAS